MRALKVLFVGVEVGPFVKVGGLGEVLRSLPKAMRGRQCDVRTIVPKYASVDTATFPMRSEIQKLHVASKEEDPHGLLVTNILRHTGKDKAITYFVENMECFEKRANVYGYADDTMRWVLFSRTTIEFIRRSKWKPDCIIANDWEAGFIPNLLKTEFQDDPALSNVRTIFCIHNLRNQGMFDAAFVSELDTDSGQGPIPGLFSPEIKKLNGMRRGILYADAIVTVSPTYAQEIVKPEYGEKLDALLQDRRMDVYGILNGIDYDTFNPETDSDIAERYTYRTLASRAVNKAALQEHFGLPKSPNTMLMSYVGRLDEQKGLSLLESNNTIRSLLDNLDFQFVVAGAGEKRFKIFFKDLEAAYPGRVAAQLEYSEKLPRMIFAGSDAVLVPSRFEPSGLVQMEAMRYGAIPIVRKTGGLADTVTDFHPEKKEGTGFVFEKFDPNALLIAIVRAYESYRNKKEWRKLMHRAMNADFSWKKSARDYIALCRKIAEKRGEKGENSSG
ncbi:glycogen synthase [Candidatus Parcubacteria bacterium]|nr:MAG: glycogen synthase [Candidatus Parcubacteria bacterium]